MAGKISELTTNPSVDRTADLLEMVHAGASYKATPNQILGITTGNPVSTGDTQTVQNKTLDNTNTVTLKASLFTLQDASDTTKQAKFSLASITSGQTRTYTLPDVTDTLVSLTASQTLTNKTLTSPTITSPTITNATISADAVTGFSVSTNGTIYGIAVTGGQIGSAAIATGAITATKIGTDASYAWTTYTPTFTIAGAASAGNAVLTGAYAQIGKTVHFWAKFTLGSTTNFTGLTGIFGSYPVTPSSNWYNANVQGGFNGSCVQGGTTIGAASYGHSSTTYQIIVWGAAGTYTLAAAITPTVPFAWANGNYVIISGIYEAA